MNQIKIDHLESISKHIRLRVLKQAMAKQKCHLGGTYSCVDLLVALYYGGFLNISKPNQDKFILSKGHACLALYCILNDLGIISDEQFSSYGEDGGLGGQMDISIPGVDWNTGSLGHSIGVGAGMALSAKMDNINRRVYMIVGDAECDEGSIWESILFASDHKLDNLTCIVDRNKMSVLGTIEDNALFRNLPKVMNAFGWNYCAVDGHSFNDLISILNESAYSGYPTMIVANTIKGKGISFMEAKSEWHNKLPNDYDFEIAVRELS